jgi:hypothetical protein
MGVEERVVMLTGATAREDPRDPPHRAIPLTAGLCQRHHVGGDEMRGWRL